MYSLRPLVVAGQEFFQVINLSNHDDVQHREALAAVSVQKCVALRERTDRLRGWPSLCVGLISDPQDLPPLPASISM